MRQAVLIRDHCSGLSTSPTSHSAEEIGQNGGESTLVFGKDYITISYFKLNIQCESKKNPP